MIPTLVRALFFALVMSAAGFASADAQSWGPWQTTATPAPPVGTSYAYHGCTLYGGNDSVVNADITLAAIDTNSAAIITHVGAIVSSFGNGDSSSVLRANLATNATVTHVVQTNGGHNPPISSGAFVCTAGLQPCSIPWTGGTFFIEGSLTGTCAGDCHFVVLNTNNCFEYEGGGGTWTGTNFGAFDGSANDFAHTYVSQESNKGDNSTVAGIPLLGFSDMGEDAALASINHPLGFFVKTTALISGSNGVNYSPGVGNGAGSCVGSTQCLELGELIRLKASFTCPVSPAASVLVCTQLKTYGAVLTDTDGTTNNGWRFGLDTNGVDPWPSTLFSGFLNTLQLSNFDIIQRGLIH